MPKELESYTETEPRVGMQYEGPVVAGMRYQEEQTIQNLRLEAYDILSDLEHHLKGEFRNERDNTWGKLGGPLLNDEGIKSIMTIVGIYVSRNTFMSNINDETICEIVYSLGNKIKEELLQEQNNWDLKVSWRLLVQLVGDFVELTLRRAENGGERNSMTQTIRTVERVMGKDGGIRDKLGAISPF